MKPGRGGVDASGKRSGAVDRVMRDTAKHLEIDGQKRYLLTHIVVQFPRDSRTFFFLRSNQPSTEIAVPLVTRAELSLVTANLLFGTAALRSLYQQAGNQD